MKNDKVNQNVNDRFIDILEEKNDKHLDVNKAFMDYGAITDEEREKFREEFLLRKSLMESAIASLSKGKNLANKHNVELLRTLRMSYKLLFLSIDNYVLLNREVTSIDTQLATIDWTDAVQIGR